ncbi:cGMP-dependent protein kinase (PbPKG) [Durusdinium trenchii]|uniref:cGMP-dependent protein kinase n=1 Tax=Durusdinium trenchii TaxID=1381693 RepID=A0ABP0LHK1_9DINO
MGLSKMIGAAFGENVILMSGGQDTTVQAKGEVEVYGLSGLRTRSLLAEQYQRERGQASSAVNEALSCESCWLLRKLTPYQVNVQSYEDGAVLLTPGHKELVALSEAVRGMGVIGYTGILYKDDGQQEEHLSCGDLQHLRMDQLDGLASLYELVNVKPGETIERPCFRLGFSLRGQVKARGYGTHRCYDKYVSLRGVGKVLIPEDADIEADKSPLLRLSLAAGDVVAVATAPRAGRTVAVFLEVVRRKKRLSASPDISPMSQSSEARQRSPSMRLAVLSDDKVGALRKVVVFRTLAPEQLHRLAEALEVVNKKPGEIIFNQGDSGKEFYIIHTGLLEVSIGGKKVRSLGMGDYVGERALLYSEPRSATVKVVEVGVRSMRILECELWRMGHEEFNQAVEGPICEYMKARCHSNFRVESIWWKSWSVATAAEFIDLLAGDWTRRIRSGEDGLRLGVVQSKTSGTRYALKCVSKKQAVEQKQQKALAHERDILAELDHPFIIKFVRSFNGPRFVYFLTELVTGGELLDALDALGLLQAPQAQFYSASIILAIEFLHERRIAYLDLKGENCLIDQHGYLKIIDFGVAERITDGRIYAVKGTPLFMAPEVILGKGYTTAADLWSLGVCLFDFMVGSFPFGDDQASNAEIFKAVLKAPLKFPKWLGVHEKDGWPTGQG